MKRKTKLSFKVPTTIEEAATGNPCLEEAVNNVIYRKHLVKTKRKALGTKRDVMGFWRVLREMVKRHERWRKDLGL